MRQEENNRNTISWHLKYYHHYFGALVYDGPYDRNPIDPLAYSEEGFDGDLLEELYCQQILDFLSPLQREVTIFRVEGYGVKEIADIRGCSCQNIQRAVSNARQRLVYKGVTK